MKEQFSAKNFQEFQEQLWYRQSTQKTKIPRGESKGNIWKKLWKMSVYLAKLSFFKEIQVRLKISVSCICRQELLEIANGIFLIERKASPVSEELCHNVYQNKGLKEHVLNLTHTAPRSPARETIEQTLPFLRILHASVVIFSTLLPSNHLHSFSLARKTGV